MAPDGLCKFHAPSPPSAAHKLLLLHVYTGYHTYNTIFTSVNMLLPWSTKLLWDKFPQTIYIYISILMSLAVGPFVLLWSTLWEYIQCKCQGQLRRWGWCSHYFMLIHIQLIDIL